MGTISFDDEIFSVVAPHKMFHAFFLDDLMPKIIPSIKSIESVSGDGGPGSIQKVNFVDESPVKYAKNITDSIDKDNLMCKYTVFESDAFGDKIDCISNELKVEASPDGGCIIKTKNTYHPKGDTVLNEDEIKGGKERVRQTFKCIESYLIDNPDVYA
ncbi:hypothetical protein MKX01_014856 [Papaver californicum]|nr:hypothetical protein MKX01_014856 [Papaver californicum]